MREGVTEPGGCHGEPSLCVNTGIHSQAPENLVPEKIHARCKARGTCFAPLQRFPLCSPQLIITLRNSSL